MSNITELNNCSEELDNIEKSPETKNSIEEKFEALRKKMRENSIEMQKRQNEKIIKPDFVKIEGLAFSGSPYFGAPCPSGRNMENYILNNETDKGREVLSITFDNIEKGFDAEIETIIKRWGIIHKEAYNSRNLEESTNSAKLLFTFTIKQHFTFTKGQKAKADKEDLKSFDNLKKDAKKLKEKYLKKALEKFNEFANGGYNSTKRRGYVNFFETEAYSNLSAELAKLVDKAFEIENGDTFAKRLTNRKKKIDLMNGTLNR